jgi:hypothetical protein
MKTSTILLQEDKSCKVEKPAKAGKVLKYLLLVFMFLQIFMLYSCAVGFRTPRHERGGVMIEGSDRHDNGRHNGRNNHYENDDRH